MDASLTPQGIIVTLSRRNVVSLLHMLDEGRTTGALVGGPVAMPIIVQPQEDAVHYGDREPGKMSWEEKALPPFPATD